MRSLSLPLVFAAIAWLIVLPGVEASAQSALSGRFKVDGKPASLTQVMAYKGDPESGKPVTILVFSAKDQGKGAKPASDALFGEFGDAIVVKLFDDGKVYSADLLHASFNLPNNTMTTFSGVTVKDFKKADGQLSGELISAGETKAP